MTIKNNVVCPVSGIYHSYYPSTSSIVNRIYKAPHPLLILTRKESKSLLNSPDIFSFSNEEVNLISISFLLASSSSQSIQENKNNNHYRKSDFLLITSQLTTKFIQESGWGKLSNDSILSAGDILFTHLNESSTSNNKTRTLRSYLPEKINLSDSNIQNVPSIIINALKERSQKVETIVRVNEEKLITSLMNDRDNTLSANSKSREFLPLRAVNYILDLINESLKTSIPKEIKEFYTSILSSSSLPIGATISDLKNFITLLDATDSTASVKFITLDILDRKLSKLSNTNFLLSLGFEDEDETTSPSGISQYQLSSFLDELSHVRNKKPEFIISNESNETKELNKVDDEFDSIFSSQTSKESQTSNKGSSIEKEIKVKLTTQELLEKIKSLQSNLPNNKPRKG